MSSTSKRMIIMLAIMGVLIGLFAFFQVFKGKMIGQFMAANRAVPQTVSSTIAKYDEWQPTFSAVGSLRAVKGADLALEVAGIVDQILFNSGDDVKAGTVLARLVSEDDEAKLRSLEAAADLANTTYNRDKRQFEAKAISQATLDVDASNVKTNQAAVAEQRAVVNKKIIRAPFDGRLGVRLVDVGQYLQPGTAVVTLQALDPIYADFYLPVDQVSQISTGEKVSVHSDTDPATHYDGEISAINPKVESASRTVLVRATLHNSERKLLPGTSVSIDIASGKPQRFITLPQTAVTYNPYGDTAFLVQDAGKDDKGNPKYIAHQTFVTTGLTRGDQVAVLTGIKEGDQVITAGQLKIQNGGAIAINNSVQPTNNPNPKPVDE